MKRATGKRKEFAVWLCKFFPEMWPDREAAVVTIRRNAPVALDNILQDYSRFAVGTIDSFFQRVIRAFAREIDIPAGYEIGLEHQAILSDAVDSLLAEVATDGKLLDWISSYVASRALMTARDGISEGRSWKWPRRFSGKTSGSSAPMTVK